MVVKGENYNFTFNSDSIDIVPKVHGLDKVHIDNNPDEDFSVFDLGPYIANDIKMLAAQCTISGNTHDNIYLRVTQEAGNYIKVEIKTQPAIISEETLDQGTQLLFLKDYVIGYN